MEVAKKLQSSRISEIIHSTVEEEDSMQKPKKPIYLRRHIMVKGEFVDLILQGKKTTTIRLGRVIPRYDEMIVHGGGRPIAKIKVKNVIVKKVRELTDEDAKKDGFSSVEELLKNLEEVYQTKINDDDLVTIIEFEVLQKFNELIPEDPYLGLEPADVARLAMRYLRKELSREEYKILEAVAKKNSIRSVAIELFGSLRNRWRIRKVLREALKMLIEKGLLKQNLK